MMPELQWLNSVSQWLFGGAFVAYLASALLYVSGVLAARLSARLDWSRTVPWAGAVHLGGLLLHGAGILARWQEAGHWPTSNMYEFIGFMAFTTMVAFRIIDRIFRLPVLGALVSPLGLFLLAYAYVFPPDIAPLVPALKSYWMPLHVSLAALGEGFFAVAFGAALLYLLRVRGIELAAQEEAGGLTDHKPMAGGSAPQLTWTSLSRWEEVAGRRGLEVLFYLVLVMTGFITLALALRYSGVQWVFETATYHLPPIIGPTGEAVGSKGQILGLIPLPLIEAPWGWRGKHLNTLLYSLVIGAALYWSVRRYWTRGPIGDYLARRVTGDPELYDEISYRAVSIGYPIFTLGGLVFAMLWAKEAWGRYWFFDPKETWALIAWLVYSAYLHFRITRGWEGRRAAWIAVLGFGVVLFTLVGVNLLIVGLHSYAGGD